MENPKRHIVSTVVRLAISVLITGIWSVNLQGQEVKDKPSESKKNPACLVLFHKAEDGKPKSNLRMNHFGLPDPKLLNRLKKLGFNVTVCSYTPGLTMDFLKKFNVVVLPHPYIDGYSVGFDDMVKEKKKLLLDYVKAGGGLLVLRTQGWQFGKDIDELNNWLAPTDIKINSEQIVDDENKITLESNYTLSWTDNITPHPVTKDVHGIFYPIYYHMYSDSTSPVKVSDDWTILIRGMKTAKSLKTVKGGNPPPPSPGTYGSVPPLMAVRDYGKGRIAVWPINSSCIWQDGYHTLWGRGLTMDGKRSNMRGDAAKLIENLFVWLKAPSRDTFGGYIPEKTKKKVEPGFARINWDKMNVSGPTNRYCFVGLIGAKSSLSTGKGTPEEFIKAAKEVGYNFIGFTEDLAKLTPEKFSKLKDTCKQLSTAEFKAYPGYSYVDESGNSWVTFSDRLRWPEKDWWSQKFPGRIKVNNPLSRGNQWPPVILINARSNPEKHFLQGNFKVFSLCTYQNGKLIDDSVDLYLRLQKMRYQLAPVSVHLVTSPDDVKKAKTNGYQTYVRWRDNNMVEALSGHIGKYKGNYVYFRSSFVSEGPVIEDGRIINFATSDMAIPTNDRFRYHIQVSAPAGLHVVEVLNSDNPIPWRRFLPKGEKTFEKTIDYYHDQQYDFIIKATDINGKVAIGWNSWTAVQENYFPRCSDNINTMPRGKWWGQPKDLQNVRGIENYLVVRNFRYMGIPVFGGVSESSRPAVEYYPYLVSRFGTIVDCLINDHYPPTIDGNLNRNDRAECAKENEIFNGKVRHIMFTPWQDGSLIEHVEGDFTVKKDFLMKSASIASFHGRQNANCVSAMMADGSFFSGQLTSRQKSYRGELIKNGFAALFYQPFRGSVGIIPTQQGISFIAFMAGKKFGNFRGLLSEKNRKMKTGDKIKYQYFGVISKLDPSPDNRFVTEIIDTLGINGKPVYQMKPEVGSIVNTYYVLRLKSDNHGFKGKISAAELPLNLPVEITGLNPRWLAGIWYKGKNNFIIPEWVVNQMNQRYIVRRKRMIKDEIRYFPVMNDGTGMLQIDTEIGDKEVFIGNLLVADNPDVHLTLTDLRPGKQTFVVHNPTDNAIICTVQPGPGFSLLGNFKRKISVPPGSSVNVKITK